MAETAPVTQFRDELIEGFEFRQSLLRSCCTTESVIKGNTATFVVVDSGGASAVTRGVNGLIPARANDSTQLSATLQEWHDLVHMTNFNIFQSQGNQRQAMQKETMAVINRKIDADIISQLDTATIDTGTSATASLAMVTKAKAALGYADVPTEEMDNLFGVVTPGFMAYLHQIPEFSSSDYVDVKMMTGRTRKMLRWYGVNWIEHPALTGAQTSTEKCYLFHRAAIGHAVDIKGLDVDADYDREQAYSWARVSGHFGSKKLQNSGIVQMKHDGSAFNLS